MSASVTREEGSCTITSHGGSSLDAADGSRDPCPRGTVVGRYMVLGLVGQGGMGLVYRAYDPELHREVALKLLRPDRHERPDAQLRLRREAQAMARISHPHVLPVYDVGTFAGRVFVAMEFVRARTLGAWLREASPPPAEILDKFVEAGNGLAAAHAVGLIHRDFKPHNVLLGDDGRARVMDFGLARAKQPPTPLMLGSLRVADDSTEVPNAGLTSSAETPLTATGNVVGTPRYMAPEQHRGLQIDARADQFSFCAALWEALYRSRPFGTGNARRLGRRKLRGAIEVPVQTHGVPPWLEPVLRRGMSPEPDDRWPDMNALLAELRRRRPDTRKPTVFVAAVVASVSLIAALVIAAWPRPPSNSVDDALFADRTIAEPSAPVDSTEASRQRKHIEAAVRAGRWSEALGLAEELVRTAQSRDDPRLRTEALALLFELHASIGDPRIARERGIDAFHQAIAIDDGTRAARLAVALADHEGYLQRRPQEARQWVAMARALMQAHGSSDELRARLMTAEATLHALGGFEERAADGFEQAMGLAVSRCTDRALGHWIAARAAEALVSAGDYASARRFRTQALDDQLTAGGADESALLQHRTAMAAIDIAEGRWARARQQLEEVLAAQQERLGMDHPALVSTLVALGDVVRDLGAPEVALSHYRRAMHITQNCCTSAGRPALQRRLAVTLADLGRFEGAAAAVVDVGGVGGVGGSNEIEDALVQAHVLRKKGELQPASRAYRRVLELAEGSPAAGARAACKARLELALLEQELGRTDEARTHLESILDEARTGRCVNRATLAQARLALARLTWRNQRERPRSRVLAELALQSFSEGVGAPAMHRDARDWLATR